MIETHPAVMYPADDTVLWRFMDFAKFVALLDTRHLFFGHVRQMEDRFEGALTRPIAGREVPFYQEMFANTTGEAGYQQFLGNFREMRDTACVSCWHMNPHESAAMWRLYLTADEGVAVRTTFGDMRRAFAGTPDTVFPAVVQYLDYTTDHFPLDNALHAVVHKRKSFEHEAEMRLVWWSLLADNLRVMGLPDTPDRPGNYQEAGRNVPVDLSALVQRVYVAPTSPGWFAHLVESVVAKYGLACPVTKSNLADDPIY